MPAHSKTVPRPRDPRRERCDAVVFFVGVVLLSVAAAMYLLAHLLVAAAPVVMLASFVAVPQFTSNASRRVVGQWGGAGGASCEDHLAFFAASYWVEARLFLVVARRRLGWKNPPSKLLP